jgi:hypothetical protein
MIHVKLGNISIAKISHSSGFFTGEKNTQKSFYSDQIMNEVVGTVSGDKNRLIDNRWLKNKRIGKEE